MFLTKVYLFINNDNLSLFTQHFGILEFIVNQRDDDGAVVRQFNSDEAMTQ